MSWRPFACHKLHRSPFVLGVSLAILALLISLGAKGAGSPTTLQWTDFQTLGVEGKGWTNTLSPYDRLPADTKGVVRDPVWDLSHCSAGLCVRFVSNATEIHVRWSLTQSWLYLPNSTAIAKSGLDLYVKTEAGWRWLAVGQPQGQTNDQELVSGLEPGKRQYLLYLPLYNGIQSGELGVPSGSLLQQAPPWGSGTRKPIVFYGTSILQGLAASRPGMVHSAILQRQFDWPVINLGFSGNGKMEPEMARLLAELDPSIYVLDCLPNMVADEIRARVEPFVKILRQHHPSTPIVLVEDRTMPAALFIEGQMEYYHLKDRAELKAAYNRLKVAGFTNIHYIPGDQLLGDDGEGTTDGSHPNDLGFMRQAHVFATILGPILDDLKKQPQQP